MGQEIHKAKVQKLATLCCSHAWVNIRQCCQKEKLTWRYSTNSLHYITCHFYQNVLMKCLMLAGTSISCHKFSERKARVCATYQTFPETFTDKNICPTNLERRSSTILTKNSFPKERVRAAEGSFLHHLSIPHIQDLLLKYVIIFFYITSCGQKCTYFALRWSENVTSARVWRSVSRYDKIYEVTVTSISRPLRFTVTGFYSARNKTTRWYNAWLLDGAARPPSAGRPTELRSNVKRYCTHR